MHYPVLDILSELKEKLAHYPVVILQAPPGAGKSTVLPLHLLKEEWLTNKKMVMLEPRRLAAKSVAERLADLHSEQTGETVGYRVRFDTKVSSKTRIEVVTEGILTRMIQSDNSLEDIGLLIFDEFHERSLHADLALALSLQVQHVLRSDLRILIMSATLDGEQLSVLLNNAPIITSTGRQFPVEYNYLQQESDTSIASRMNAAIRKALREEEGDVLAFLPGAGEINRTQQLLDEEGVAAKIHPLFGDLPFKQQQEAILPRSDGQRKIVLATSIAETSLTIEGIRIVIDSGMARVPRFDPRSGLTHLETIRVTKDAADQRAGRAGRLGPGVCYRLWTEGTQRNLIPQRKPEILEADLAPLLLELGQWGIKEMKELTWITSPPAGAVSQARELLQQLDALDSNGVITSRGKEMLRLPTHPRIAHLLLSSITGDKRTTVSLAADIAALLEERDPLPKESGADLSLRVEALRRWRKGERVNAERNVLERIEKLAANWRRIFKAEPDTAIASDSVIGKLLLAAYPERIALQQGNFSERYKLANGRIAKLPDHDSLTREKWLCIAQLDGGSKEAKIFMAASVDESDLLELAEEQEVVRWDEERGAISGLIERRVGPLLLGSKPSSKINEEQRIKILLEVVRQQGLKVIGWDEAQEQWQNRVHTLKSWRPGEPWPDVTEPHLLESLEEWLAPYLQNVYRKQDFERLDKMTVLAGLLPWELQSKLDVLAPLQIKVPSGSQIKVHYFSDERPPVIEVRLQEMFGLMDTPAINEGRTKVLLHLLSPGYKPVQVTQDLKSFWQTTYHEVRKELRMRYPRHHWPEDPWTAEAVRGAKKRT
ncbi:MAG: ATP-dependent helicase HrpB [Azospira oryzae]|jgi:ATP-dependent helicase HrpB|nr:MAG: ATP-dependent helicase HrpB [Azospira oryzae]